MDRGRIVDDGPPARTGAAPGSVSRHAAQATTGRTAAGSCIQAHRHQSVTCDDPNFVPQFGRRRAASLTIRVRLWRLSPR